MKLLVTYFDPLTADKLKDFLEEKGIAVYIQDSYMRRGGGRKYLVYSALDFQHEDALALMSNPDHPVNNPVNLEEYREYVESNSAKIDTLPVMLNALMKIMAVIIGLIVVVIFIKYHLT